MGQPNGGDTARVSKLHRFGSKPQSLPSWAAFELPPVTDGHAD
jgi:hypothetical protein